MVRRFIAGIVLVFGTANAQSSSRAEELEQRREQEGGVYPRERSRVEDGFVWIADHKILERLTRGVGGLRLMFGQLVTGSGFALGPEYFREDLADGAVQFRASARGSARKYVLGEVQLGFPRLFGRRAFLDLHTRWRNFPGVNYFGPGPDSLRTDRTGYRIEGGDHGFDFGIRPVRHVRLGTTGSYLQLNVGPGADRRYIGTERLFTPAEAPGIDRQPDYLTGGVFAEYDWRDHPGGARFGGLYSARFEYLHDQDLNLYTHRRLRLEAQQYVPFFNRRRVIALRAMSVLTYQNPGQRVPFYLQPTVGGSDDLRGFLPYRFHDNNMLVLNGEYRWEIFTGLDGALFYDAGKVFPKRSQLNFRNLEGSAGFGFRLNVGNTVFMRIDFGFSHEGAQAWLKFRDLF
jgi:hypothetical protein